MFGGTPFQSIEQSEEYEEEVFLTAGLRLKAKAVHRKYMVDNKYFSYEIARK